MPTTLRGVLRAHRERLLEGARWPLLEGGGRDRGVGRLGEGLQARVAAQSRRVRRMMEERAPLEELAFELGVLSHYLADANHPLLSSDADPREPTYRESYARYLEKQVRNEKFRVVFTGYRDAFLEEGDLAGFVKASRERSGRHYPRIGQDYYRNGRLVSSDIFDEFSFAFGVGQLSYSHAVGDTAKLWLRLWMEAGGDIEGLPLSQPRKR
jgi:hypothetical protein